MPQTFYLVAIQGPCGPTPIKSEAHTNGFTADAELKVERAEGIDYTRVFSFTAYTPEELINKFKKSMEHMPLDRLVKKHKFLCLALQEVEEGLRKEYLEKQIEIAYEEIMYRTKDSTAGM